MYNYAMIIGKIEDIHRFVDEHKEPVFTQVYVKIKRSLDRIQGEQVYDYISVHLTNELCDVFDALKLSIGDTAIFKGYLNSKYYGSISFEVSQILRYDTLQTK